MNKLFKDIKEGDKIYFIEILCSKLRHDKGESFVKSHIARHVNMTSSTFGYGSSSITLDDSSIFFPRPEQESHIHRNCYDMSPYKKLNAYVYGTTKKACIDAAIKIMEETANEETEIKERLEQVIKENRETVELLAEGLKEADFPDTIEEFAEMALA